MIIVRVFDGLGNQLFHYAYARALQEKGFEVYLDTQKPYEDFFRKYRNHTRRENKLHHFRIKLSEAKDKDIKKYSYLRKEKLVDKLIFFLAGRGFWWNKYWQPDNICEGIDESVLKIGNFYLDGWYQKEDYFKSIRPQLLKELRPKKKIKISKELRELLQYEALVAVHIRRGDYVKIGNTLSGAYYRHAIEIMDTKYLHPRYLFFSDDINWVKSEYGNMSNAYFISDYGKFEDYEELMIMSSCKANIIANSSFSWWGAWLNKNPNKVVIAPRKWFNTQEDIVPKEWIKI